MHNVLIISGTRPEIIKLAPVYQQPVQAPWAHVNLGTFASKPVALPALI